MNNKYCNHHLLCGNRCLTCEREKGKAIDHKPAAKQLPDPSEYRIVR